MEQIENLVRIIAALTTDGHLQLDKRRGVVSFYSKELQEINNFNQRYKSLFQKEGKIFVDNRLGNKRYKLFIPHKVSAIYLNKKGTPAGNKTKASFTVPEWIKQGNSTIKVAYLQTIFDCEGSIYQQADGRWRLTYTMYKSITLKDNAIYFLEEIKQMLEDLGIETSRIRTCRGNIRKDGSLSIQLKFEIKNKSFNTFQKRVHFENKHKREKMLKALK